MRLATFKEFNELFRKVIVKINKKKKKKKKEKKRKKEKMMMKKKENRLVEIKIPTIPRKRLMIQTLLVNLSLHQL